MCLILGTATALSGLQTRIPRLTPKATCVTTSMATRGKRKAFSILPTIPPGTALASVCCVAALLGRTGATGRFAVLARRICSFSSTAGRWRVPAFVRATGRKSLTEGPRWSASRKSESNAGEAGRAYFYRRVSEVGVLPGRPPPSKMPFG